MVTLGGQAPPPLFLEALNVGVGLGWEGSGALAFLNLPRHLTVCGGRTGLGCLLRHWPICEASTERLLSLTEGCLLGSPNYNLHSPTQPLTPSLTSLCCLGPAMGAEGTQEWKGLGAGGGVPTHSTASKTLGTSPSLLSLRLLSYKMGGGMVRCQQRVLPARRKQGPG